MMKIRRAAILVLVLLGTADARPRVIRYRCILSRYNEILCFQPADGAMFRPERRFREFILEVPSL